MAQTVPVVLLFFAIISMVGFTVLRILSSLSRKRKNKITEHSESKEQTEQQPVNIFTANGNIQAEMILNTLKQKGIMAYGQDLGDAGFASVRYGMGRGIDDRIAIFVAEEQADAALQVLNGLGL